MPVEFEDRELLQEFTVESLDHLADIESQFLTIESQGLQDIELVNTVFRAVHSIKGAAGFFGLTSIQGLSHSMENVLNLMREGKLIPDSAMIDVMLKSADSLKELLEDIEGSNDVDVSAHVTVLEGIAAGNVATAPQDEAEPAQSTASEECEQRESETPQPVDADTDSAPPAPIPAKPVKA